MPTPKRAAAEVSPSTPRSSKRLRAAKPEVEIEAPATTPSKSPAKRSNKAARTPSSLGAPVSPPLAKSSKRTKATVAVATSSGKTVVAKVEKRDPPRKDKETVPDPRETKVKAEVTVVDADGSTLETGLAKQTPKRRKAVEVKTKVNGKVKIEPGVNKQKAEDTNTAADNSDGAAAKSKSKGRKSKAQKTAEMTAATLRTTGLRMFLGAHVSAAGGVQNAVGSAKHIGANSFALFLKNQKRWENPALAPDARDGFVQGCEAEGYSAADHVLPHGSYLVNLAQKDPDKAKQAFTTFVDDLRRCDALGIRLYNFHPGSTGGEPRPEALGRIADAINRAHAETKTAVPVLENMAGKGNVVGGRFEDLRDIIAGVKDKSRVGVCIDTCHAFAAGYDLRSPAAFRETLSEFDKVVGKKYLKALHLNDSKAPLGSHRDLHADIGTGYLGLRAFHNIMNEKSFEGLPMVLETPSDVGLPYSGEIKLLEGLIGMDLDGPEFQEAEIMLRKRGDAERDRVGGQVDRKKAKDEKKGKGKKRKKDESEEDEDEDD